MNFGTTLGEHIKRAASANIATNYKNKTNMKIAASNINMKTH